MHDHDTDRPDEEIGLRRVGKPKFWTAMAAYAGIAVLAGLTLNGPTRFEFLLRTLVWLLLGAMALKTVLHHLRDRMHDREQ